MPSSRTGCWKFRPQFFSRVIAKLRRSGLDLVSLDEMYRRLTERDFRRRFACITFDDGYRDLMQWAYPVLRKHEVPFALYIPTSFPDRIGELWWLALERVIAENNRIGLLIDGQERRFDCATHRRKARAVRRALLVAARARNRGRIARASCAICATRYGVDMKAFCEELCMTWDEIATLARDPLVTIGAHTVNHVILKKTSDRVARVRTGNGPRGDRSGDRRAAGASRLSGRRPDLGRRARISLSPRNWVSRPRRRPIPASCFRSTPIN